MTTATWTIIAYLSLVTALGLYLSRRNRDSADWATGSGGMGSWMIVAGIAGTRIGGAGSYGVAGEVIHTGIWNAWYGISTFLALACVGLFFAVPYRRLGLTTIGELFVRRYGRARSAVLASLCVQTEFFIINVIEPLLIGVILRNVTGVPLFLGILIGATVIILATASSGLQGTAMTNIIHCAVILVGFALVAWAGMAQMGGWGAVVERADAALLRAGVDQANWWSLVGAGWFPILSMFFSAAIHTPAVSVYVNYSSAARQESILAPSFLLAGLVAALMPFLAAIIGIEALAQYGADAGIAGYNSITQIALGTGPFIGGVALAAVLAAIISSAGPILLASSTMFVNDWIPASAAYTPTRKLLAYRITAVIYGSLAAGIACIFGYFSSAASILEWLLLGFAMVVPPAIAIGYIFYLRSTTEQGVFWGIASGYGLGLASWIVNRLFLHREADISAYFTTLAPLMVIPLVSALTQSTEGDPRAEGFYRLLRTPDATGP